MKKTIKNIIEDGYNYPAKYPELYYNQEVYTKADLVKERCKARLEVMNNPEKYGLCKLTKQKQVLSDNGVPE